ncbi:unnamed protein product, partial [Ilex paraguariensis]
DDIFAELDLLDQSTPPERSEYSGLDAGKFCSHSNSFNRAIEVEPSTGAPFYGDQVVAPSIPLGPRIGLEV